MTSTVPISQPVAAPSVASGERGGRGGTKTTEENAFSGLLSKVAAGNQEGGRRQAKVDGDASPPEGEHSRRPFMWVAVSADALDPSQAGVVQPGETAVAIGGGAVAGGAAAALPPEAPSVTLPPAVAAIVMAAASAGMPAPQPGRDEPPFPGHQGGQMPLPDQATDMKPQSPAPVLRETPRETVNITVVKQETHFAPVVTTLAAAAARPPAPAAAGPAVDDSGRPAAAEESTGRRAVPGDPTEGLPAATRPMILTAVHARTGSGQDARSSGGGAQRDAMPGFAPMIRPRGEAAASGGDAAIPVDANVASVRADAFAGGGATSSAVALIAECIASEVNTEVARRGQSGQATLPAQAAPVKVLHIQLQPAELGTVTVRMSLKENALQLDLEVSRGETAQLLQRDKEALSSLLRSAGYLVEGMDVRVSADSGAQGPQSATGGTHTGPQMQGGGQPGSSHADARSPGGRSEGTERGTSGDGRYENDGQVAEPSRGGGVYV